MQRARPWGAHLAASENHSIYRYSEIDWHSLHCDASAIRAVLATAQARLLVAGHVETESYLCPED